MARKSSLYKKMPGKWFTAFGRETLYQGPDHLLWLQGSLIKEHYKRFYYTDIQALMICRNRRQHFWTAFWAGLAALFILMAVFAADTNYVAEVFIAMWAICLIVNLVKGPCCDMYLQTAVQLEKLSHLARERMASKTLDRIKAQVEAAQGPFSWNAEAAQGLVTTSTASANEPFVLNGEPFNPKLHYALFGLLLLVGLMGVGRWQWPLLIFPVAGLIGYFGAVVFTIMVLVRWQRHIKRTLLSFSSWTTLAWLAVYAVGLYVLFVFTSLRHPDLAYDQTGLLKAFFRMHLADHPVAGKISMAVSVTTLLLGGLGLVAVVLQRRRHTRSDPASANVE